MSSLSRLAVFSPFTMKTVFVLLTLLMMASEMEARGKCCKRKFYPLFIFQIFNLTTTPVTSRTKRGGSLTESRAMTERKHFNKNEDQAKIKGISRGQRYKIFFKPSQLKLRGICIWAFVLGEAEVEERFLQIPALLGQKYFSMPYSKVK